MKIKFSQGCYGVTVEINGVETDCKADPFIIEDVAGTVGEQIDYRDQHTCDTCGQRCYVSEYEIDDDKFIHFKALFL